MWKLSFIFHVLLTLGTTDLIDGLNNTVVRAGQRLEMTCHAHKDSIVREWSLQKPFTSNTSTISANWKGRITIMNTHFGIAEGSDGSTVLHTNSTEMNDAGIYTCVVQGVGAQPERYSAQLIVIETGPICETNLSTSQNETFEEGTHILMRCTVNFTGNWTPTLKWRLHEDNGRTTEEPIDLADCVDVVIVPNAKISSSLTVALNSTMNSSYFSCTLCLTQEQSSQMVTANNSPDYNYEWKFPLMALSPKTVASHTRWEVTTTDVSGKSSTADLTSISTKVEASKYESMSPDGYDAIEEVNETDDILFQSFPPRQGPLPSPGYSGLMPAEPKPPVVYLRMDDRENSVDDGEGDAGEKNSQSDTARINPARLNESNVEETSAKRTVPVNSYLVLETAMDIVDDKATEGEQIESANFIIANDSLLPITTDNDQEAFQQHDIPSSYLTTREIS